MRLPALGLIGQTHLLTVTLSTCSLLYEFILMYALTLLCGEGIFYHSIVIGLYLFSMGLGAQLSDRFITDVGRSLIRLQLALSLVGGVAAIAVFGLASLSIRYRGSVVPALAARFGEELGLGAVLASWDPVLIFAALAVSTLPTLALAFCLTVAIGVMSGLELPLLMALYRSHGEKRDIPHSLFFDYVGGFVASILFPFLLLPYLTIFQIGLFAALLNGAAALHLCGAAGAPRGARPACLGLLAALGVLLGGSGWIQDRIDRNVYYQGPDTNLTASFHTRYQKVTVAESQGGRAIALYLNSFLQWTYLADLSDGPLGVDNHHSMLVHPALALHPSPGAVLILGGGDGLPAREALKHRGAAVTNVDIDGRFAAFSRDDPTMRRINRDSFRDPRVKLRIQDAFLFARTEPAGRYDVILKDFPEGVNEVLARSHSFEFFRDLGRILSPDGILSIHTDYYGRGSYWTAVRSLQAAGFTHVLPLQDDASDPDHLEGIILASRAPFALERLTKNRFSRLLLDRGVLPSVDELHLRAAPEHSRAEIARTGAELNSIFRLSFLRKQREELGFLFPLEFPIGAY